MEWESVGVVLSATPFGEGHAVVTLLTREHGAHRGLARGARSRGPSRSTWEVGNILRVRWVSRLADQLGAFTGETLQAPSSGLFDAPLALTALASVCAVAGGALPERAAYPQTYDGMIDLLAGLSDGRAGIPWVVRWEAALLGELGYGLDLSRCAVTGGMADLAYVSPRSGCAVSDGAAAAWRDKLLVLPRYMLDAKRDHLATAVGWADGLALTGHFLARDAFGFRNQPVPAVRQRLIDMVTRLHGS